MTPHFRYSALPLLALAIASCRGCSTADEQDRHAPPGASAELIPDSGRLAACPRFSAPRALGSVEPQSIVEASGIVASLKSPGVLWVHNDSGNAEQLYAMSSAGKGLATYSLSDASCVDWEDMALGRGPGGRYHLYIGDIGTNQGARNPVVYRVEEPDVRLGQAAVEGSLDRIDRFELSYPDGQSYDSETLLIDPISGDLFLVTKTTSGTSGVYRAAAPLLSGSARTLEQVATLRTENDGERGSERTTGGTISPDGSLILIKTYTRAYLWMRAEGQSIGEALRALPCPAPLPREPQGEAIGFSANNKGYFTLSEGTSQPIYFLERNDY
jgi:hypothetical protein